MTLPLRTPELDLTEPPEIAELRATVSKALRKDNHHTWTALGRDLGLAGLLIPETSGGDDAGPAAAGAVATTLGYELSPTPFLTSAVLATTILRGCDTSVADCASLLTELAAVTRAATLVVPATTSPHQRLTSTVAASSSGDRTVALSGIVELVMGLEPAARLVVPAQMNGALVVVLVHDDNEIGTGSGERVSPMVSMDETRRVATVELTGLSGTVIASGEQAETAVTDALMLGAAVLCAERVGVMEWAVETTAEHLRSRHQFGRPLGAFQTLRHTLARMWIDTAQARAVTTHALAAIATDPDEAGLSTALAASFTADHCLAVVEQALQMHGGTGFTWEHPLHRYLKRAVAGTAVLGTAEQHRAAVARLAHLEMSEGTA